MLKFHHRICVPQVVELKEEIMKEARCIPYTTHPGS